MKFTIEVLVCFLALGGAVASAALTGFHDRIVSVGVRYLSSSAQPIGGSPAVPVNFSTVDYDTDKTVSTGSNWLFTAPIAGLYLITSQATMNGTWTAADQAAFNVLRNGTAIQQLNYRYIDVGYTGDLELSGWTTFLLQRGDTIQLTLYHTSTSKTLSGSASDNLITINRISD